MPANTEPIFTLTSNVGMARLTAANTASDGSGSLSDLFTAGANGSLVFRVRVLNSQQTAAASSAMVMRIFVTDTGGANPRLLYESTLDAATRSTTVIGSQLTIPFGNGLSLASGQKLQVCQSVYAGAQDQTDYIAEGGDF